MSAGAQAGAKHPVVQILEKGIPFVGRSGLEIEEFEPGHVRVRMPAEGNGNHVNIMYAGALFTLAEISGAALVSSVVDFDKAKVVVKGMEIDFRRAFNAGEDAYVDMTAPAGLKEMIESELAEHGKTIYELPVELSDKDGNVRAVAKVAYRFKKLG